MSTDTKLAGVNPVLGQHVRRIIAAMHVLGFEMMVTDGRRTVAEQQALYAQGRTTPGKTVTNADGVKNISNHQTGRAVDMCFVVDGKPSWAESNPWKLYGEIADALGLNWGGDWRTKKDRPHIELPEAE